MFDQIFNIDFLKNNIESQSVDCIITDPPYLINYKDWDKKEKDFHINWLQEVDRILKPGGTLWSFMAYCSSDGQELLSAEFYKYLNIYFNVDLRNSNVWARQKGRGASKHLKSVREDIFYAVKPGGKPTWNNLQMLRTVIAPYVKDGRPRGWFLDEFGNRVRWTGLGNVWTYTSPCWSSKPETQFHPTQKPVMLLERLIRLSTNEDDIILDPFMGSGSTGIASLLSNRKFIGCEINKKFFKDAKKRIDTFNIFDYPGFNIDIDKKIIESIHLGIKIDKKQINKIKNNIPKQLWNYGRI